jgi:hypothetical protein
MPFVVPAQELAFSALFANQKQQVAIRRLNVQHIDGRGLADGWTDFKELTGSIMTDVKAYGVLGDKGRIDPLSAWGNAKEFDPCTDALELAG